MKKIFPIFIVTVLFLSGCQMPFTPNQKDAVIDYIDVNANIVTASTEIDKKLIEHLEKAEKNKISFDKLMNDVRKSKDMQEDLYDSIDFEKTDKGAQEVKTIYLQYIQQRKSSYNTFISTLAKEDYKTLQLIVEEHKIKDKELTEKTLAKVNKMLVSFKEKERKALDELPKKKK